MMIEDLSNLQPPDIALQHEIKIVEYFQERMRFLNILAAAMKLQKDYDKLPNGEWEPKSSSFLEENVERAFDDFTRFEEFHLSNLTEIRISKGKTLKRADMYYLSCGSGDDLIAGNAQLFDRYRYTTKRLLLAMASLEELCTYDKPVSAEAIRNILSNVESE